MNPRNPSFQKFRRGDLVHITKDMPRCMQHFECDQDAIVMGSYAEEYGGGNPNDHKQYTLLFWPDGDECSWYDEDQLTFLRHVGEDGIESVSLKRAERESRERDLDWIVANWNRIRENPPGATMSALLKLAGIDNPWGPNGEGYVYHANMMALYRRIDPVLQTADKEAVLSKLNELKEIVKRNHQPKET